MFKAHDIQEHLLRSCIVGDTYRIKVHKPVSRADGSERFAVLYTTDADDFFGGLAAIANILQFHGETPRFILVGIGYKSSRAAGLLRMRDFYTQTTRSLFQKEIEQLADSDALAGVVDLTQITSTTDARQFLEFIRDELMPFIISRYPAMPNENSYFGYSSGGAFGLYTLFTRPDTFRCYILGSPATSYMGHHFGIALAEAFIKSDQQLNTKVFMCVGELEEFKKGLEQFDLVTGMYLLGKFLRKSAIPGLDLRTHVFPGETHATAWTLAFIHGLKALFGPAESVPFRPKYLK